MGGAPRPGAPSETSTGLVPASIGALGVVYGDIGTSPLYALRECFHNAHGIAVNPANVLGILSLIIWALILVISIKYLLFVLRADNNGEGGILALMSLISPRAAASAKSRLGIVIALGLFGAALLYGDGVITPAISVLSAIEGLKVATPFFEPYVILITAALLIGLFFAQSHGTAKIGKAFGPVMIIWFSVMGLLGLRGIIQQPMVLFAFNPLHGLSFLFSNSGSGFAVLGSVVLVVTGGEALYADMGHFGRLPIRLGWFCVALPGLVLQYLGQGALLINDPHAVENPFYLLAPSWALYPLVGLATTATIIASQAMITGAFSLSQQAVQLGYLPRIQIKHTSESERGQIYVPFINWVLLLGTLFLVFEFQTSSSLAGAYGIAVTATMAITSMLMYVVMVRRWKWPFYTFIPLTALSLVIEFSFLGASSMKIIDGGWFPILLAGGIFILMTTWKTGRKILAERMVARSIPLEDFVLQKVPTLQTRVPGTSVFLTATSKATPSALVQNVLHNQVLHATVLVLTVKVEDVPRVARGERLAIEDMGAGIFRVIASYGFIESPHVPNLLKQCIDKGLDITLDDTTYFLGRETLIATERRGMAMWRERIFAFMSRNAQRATDYFQIPADRAIEIGTVVEI